MKRKTKKLATVFPQPPNTILKGEMEEDKGKREREKGRKEGTNF